MKAKTIKKKLRREQIGEVGVDSGQLMVCDPCYIESEWRDMEKGEHLETLAPIFLDNKGRKWGCAHHHAAGKGINLFAHYEMPLTEFDGLTANELVASQIWKETSGKKPSGEFSYPGACQATHNSQIRAGQMKFTRGHNGAGVAFRSGWGDGVYPVYAIYNDEGRIIKVEIEMG